MVRVGNPIQFFYNELNPKCLDSSNQAQKEKIEKHIEESLPILENQLSPFEAFRKGCEIAIASYIKLGNEGCVTEKLVYGPQEKNINFFIARPVSIPISHSDFLPENPCFVEPWERNSIQDEQVYKTE